MKKLAILSTIVLVVLLPVVSVIGCQQQPKPTPPAPTPTPIPGPVHGISCEYPEGWVGSVTEMELDPARPVHYNIIRTVTVFAGPLVGEYDYMVNIKIVREELPKDRTLEDYVRIVEEDTKRQYIDYTKVDEYSTTIGGLSAIVRTFTATTMDVRLKNIQALFIEDTDNVGYVITYDVPEEFHDEYADSFELVISTVKFGWK